MELGGKKKPDEYESFAVTAPPGFKRQLSDYLWPNEAFCSRYHWVFFHPLLFPDISQWNKSDRKRKWTKLCEVIAPRRKERKGKGGIAKGAKRWLVPQRNQASAWESPSGRVRAPPRPAFALTFVWSVESLRRSQHWVSVSLSGGVMSRRPTNHLGSDLLLQTGRISHLTYIKPSIAASSGVTDSLAVQMWSLQRQFLKDMEELIRLYLNDVFHLFHIIKEIFNLLLESELIWIAYLASGCKYYGPIIHTSSTPPATQNSAQSNCGSASGGRPEPRRLLGSWWMRRWMRVGVNRHQSTNRRGWNERGTCPILSSERQPGNFGLTNRCRRLHRGNYPDKQQCELFHLFVAAYFLGLPHRRGPLWPIYCSAWWFLQANLIYIYVQAMKCFPCWTSRRSALSHQMCLISLIYPGHLLNYWHRYFKHLFHKFFRNTGPDDVYKSKRGTLSSAIFK